MIIKMCLCTCLWQLICLFLEVTYSTVLVWKPNFHHFLFNVLLVLLLSTGTCGDWLLTAPSQPRYAEGFECVHTSCISNVNSCFSVTMMVLCCVLVVCLSLLTTAHVLKSNLVSTSGKQETITAVTNRLYYTALHHWIEWSPWGRRWMLRLAYTHTHTHAHTCTHMHARTHTQRNNCKHNNTHKCMYTSSFRICDCCNWFRFGCNWKHWCNSTIHHNSGLYPAIQQLLHKESHKQVYQ